MEECLLSCYDGTMTLPHSGSRFESHDEAVQLHMHGVDVFTIGIGAGINEPELLAMASSPKAK